MSKGSAVRQPDLISVDFCPSCLPQPDASFSLFALNLPAPASQPQTHSLEVSHESRLAQALAGLRARVPFWSMKCLLVLMERVGCDGHVCFPRAPGTFQVSIFAFRGCLCLQNGEGSVSQVSLSLRRTNRNIGKAF